MPTATAIGILILAVGTATALLVAGYLFGVINGRRVRGQLSQQVLEQTEEAEQLYQQIMERTEEAQRLQAQLTSERAGATVYRQDIGKMMDLLAKQSDVLQRAVSQVAERNTPIDDLRLTLQQALAPLIRREQLALDLANVHAASGERGDLRRLLDEIAEKGHFGAVLLCDDHGLPLAVSSDARELDRLTMVSSLVALFADRLSRDGTPAPLSLIIHGADNDETLCRIFHVGDQRLLLTAVSTGVPLSPMALDATLQQVNRILSQPTGALSSPPEVAAQPAG